MNTRRFQVFAAATINLLVVAFVSFAFVGVRTSLGTIGSGTDIGAPQVPSTSPCEVDGNGSVDGPHGGSASFNFVVHYTNKGKTRGSFTYNDPDSGISFFFGKRISNLVFIGSNHARFTGVASIKKHVYSFTVDAYDNASSGAADEFFIQISNGYSAGGFLTSGEIDIGPCTE